VHVSWNGLRLGALVVAASASGYLWRAAFEPSRAPVIVRLAPPPTHPEIVIHATRSPLATYEAVAPPVRVRPTLRPHRAPATDAVVHTAAPPAHTYVSVPTHRASQPRTKPKPATTPKPSPPAPPPQPSPPAPAPTAQPQPTAPTVAPAPQPASPPSVGASDESATESSKPGWGHGDKNHDHDGPPGDKQDK
jgi:hypothetical protein